MEHTAELWGLAFGGYSVYMFNPCTTQTGTAHPQVTRLPTPCGNFPSIFCCGLRNKRIKRQRRCAYESPWWGAVRCARDARVCSGWAVGELCKAYVCVRWAICARHARVYIGRSVHGMRMCAVGARCAAYACLRWANCAGHTALPVLDVCVFFSLFWRAGWDVRSLAVGLVSPSFK